MSSQLRYKRGDTKPVVLPISSATAAPIEKGDLVFIDPVTKKAKPASAMIDQGTLALNQDAFQQYFAGVALEKVGLQSGETSFNLNTNDGYIVVATEGEFEFDCEAYAWTAGELVAGCENDAGTALKNQKVVAVAAGSESKAIGKAVPGKAAIGVSLTKVAVRIKSTIFESGVLQQVAGSSSGVL